MNSIVSSIANFLNRFMPNLIINLTLTSLSRMTGLFMIIFNFFNQKVSANSANGGLRTHALTLNFLINFILNRSFLMDCLQCLVLFQIVFRKFLRNLRTATTQLVSNLSVFGKIPGRFFINVLYSVL